MLLYQIRISLMILVILVTLVAWWRMPLPRTVPFRIVGLITILALVLEVTGYLTTIKGINNSVLYNGFSLVEFILVLLLVYTYRPRWRAACMAAGVVGSAGMVWSYRTNDPFAFLLTEGIVAVAFASALLLLALLWDMARTSEVALHRVPEFWLFMGLLIYFGGLSPLLGMVRFIYADRPDVAHQLWSIMPLLSILRYLFTAVACHQRSRNARH